MFDDALIELMQYIWHHWLEDISVWEVLPKWFEDWLDPTLLACSRSHAIVLVNQQQYSKNCYKVSKLHRNVWTSQLIPWYITLQTLSWFDSCRQQLFQVTCRITGKNQMSLAYDSIPTCHGNTIFSRDSQWL
jgi:hypothetical protein